MESVETIRKLKEELSEGLQPYCGMTVDRYHRWQVEFAEALIKYAEELEKLKPNA